MSPPSGQLYTLSSEVTIASIDTNVSAIIDDVASTMNVMSIPNSSIATTPSGTLTTTVPAGLFPFPGLSKEEVVYGLVFEYHRVRMALEEQLASLTSGVSDDQTLICAIQQALASPHHMISTATQLTTSLTSENYEVESVAVSAPPTCIIKHAREESYDGVDSYAARDVHAISESVSAPIRPKKLRKLAAEPIPERQEVEPPTRTSSRILERKLVGQGAPRKGVLIDYFDYVTLPSAPPKRRTRKSRAGTSASHASQTTIPSPKSESVNKIAEAKRLPRTQAAALELQTESPSAEKSSSRRARTAARLARLGN